MENNGYKLGKQWWNFRFTTKEQVTSRHTEMYLYLVELNNKLKWIEVFGIPTDYTMSLLKMSYNTYKKTLNDLIKWGFIKLYEKAKNQYTSNRIALSKFDKAGTTARTIALSPYKNNKNSYKGIEGL